jgi:hypothetical protein
MPRLPQVSPDFLEKQSTTIFPGGDRRVHFDKFLREMRAGDEIYLYDNSQQQPEDRLADVMPKPVRHCRVGPTGEVESVEVP